MKTAVRLICTLPGLCLTSILQAQVVEYSGSADALPHEQYVHVVSETDSPVMQQWVKSKDGAYVAASIRKPAGSGPFPAVIMFHGAPGGRGMEQLVGWSRGDHGGPVWERYLQEGFVVVVADYRGGDFNLMNTPSGSGFTTAIDDGMAVVDFVGQLPYVDDKEISLYGVSLGGNLVLFLASQIQGLNAVVAGAPAAIWFLGISYFGKPGDGTALETLVDSETAAANIAPIETPVLIQVGTEDPLLALDHVLYSEFVDEGKAVRMEVYEHGYHDFVLGPQGHDRPDLPRGEILLQGGLDALERSLAFIRSGSL